MHNLTFDKAREIWKRVVKSKEERPLSFDIKIHKRLLDLFHVGPYYYYVFNCATGEFEYLDEKAATITGYPQEKISPSFLYSKLHPEDVSYVLNFEDAITTFYEQLPIERKLNYKTSYDYRIRNSTGNYIRVLQQVTAIQAGVDGSVYRTLGIHTDITHLKPEGVPILNLMGLDGAPSYTNIQTAAHFEPTKPVLTSREKEIVKLLAEGYNTSKIADRLYISMNTVQTHRRNIMRKTNADSPAELVRIAITNGWI